MIITAITNFIIHIISSGGYAGVAFLMAIESAAIPLPSEIIMPFAGYLVSGGRFTLLGIALAGGLGSVIGSLVTYWIGRFGGRPLIERYGKYVLISERDLDVADNFFIRFGGASVFIGRVLPVVRTFISIPAGIARVPLAKFITYTFIGSVLWSALLGYAGMKLGPSWIQLREQFHWIDYVVIGLIVVGLAWWIWRHFRRQKGLVS